MLTRLKVDGFKNLVGVDVRFGPFTCVAGANGVGKSNLFDALSFLSALATKPLMEAALSVRDEAGKDRPKSSDVRGLFHRIGDSLSTEIAFEVEMLVPPTAVDEFGQTAQATITFLSYSLRLGLRADTETWASLGALEILEERLTHITKGDTKEHLLFPHSDIWRDGVARGVRRAPAFISTKEENGQRRVLLHQDGGSSGKPLSKPAANLPRTMLSSANAAENPTVLCAKREMESWVLLQLEPSALRTPDEIHASPHLGTHGEHLPATLYRLAHNNRNGDSAAIYARLGNRLAALIDDANAIAIERDDKHETLTLEVTGRNGTTYPARSLSDGTLRFLALAVMEIDSDTQGVVCLEEPENGIHPERIPAMLRLLRDIAADPEEEVDETNPLRQVMVNTHSPAVVLQVPPESLLFADARQDVSDRGTYLRTVFHPLPNTWRTRPPANEEPLALGKLLAYLKPVVQTDEVRAYEQRVVDTHYVQDLFKY